jgi:hypothetical protein
MVAGAYSSEHSEDRLARFQLLQDAARQVFSIGHTPVIGLNQALPMFLDLSLPLWQQTLNGERKIHVERMSKRLAAHCDAIVVLSRSRGVDLEVREVESRGGIVLDSLSSLSDLTGRGSPVE